MMALERVTKWYGLRRRAPVLRDVDLMLEPAEVVTVTGANGSGKSTLLRILAGSSVPSRGRVRGRPDRTGYVPDRFPPRLRFTPTEYLRHMAGIRGLSTVHAGELAERLGFTRYLHTRMAELSKGNCQKVALAQALIGHPELLVLDEPWSGLDERTRRELASILSEARQRGSCVVVSEHHVTAVADRVFLLASGGLTTHEPPESRVLVELVRPDGTVLRSRVPRHQVDKMLAQALHDGLSVRRVEP